MRESTQAIISVRSAEGSTVAVDAVVTHHTDGFRSGVVRFNELMAEQLGVPLLALGQLSGDRPRKPLLSFKLGELDAEAVSALEAWLATGAREWEFYLHDFSEGDLGRRLVAGADRVHCGNLEIEEQVADLTTLSQAVWTPTLITDDRAFPDVELSVFSFGMAHKIRLDMFRLLKRLLERSGRSYALYASAATHETASLRDSESIFADLHDIFPDSLYFLGNLSDVAVVNQMRSATFFATFFQEGVRDNNTTVAAAMALGAVTITNLDRHSPVSYLHMENLIDIHRCDTLPTDPEVLRRISGRAVESSRSRGWDALLERLRS